MTDLLHKVQFLGRVEIFLSTIISRLALGYIELFFQWVLGVLPLKVKQARKVTTRSPKSRMCAVIAAIPHTSYE
jgi:hypothetical protein